MTPTSSFPNKYNQNGYKKTQYPHWNRNNLHAKPEETGITIFERDAEKMIEEWQGDKKKFESFSGDEVDIIKWQVLTTTAFPDYKKTGKEVLKLHREELLIKNLSSSQS